MDYVPASGNDIKVMLNVIGVNSFDSLTEEIPSDILINQLNIPSGISEFEAGVNLKKLAGLNTTVDDKNCFLGGGAYDHFIPSVVPSLASRSEFATAYTPYQPEASQGTLQAVFEYQSMICEITGLEVSNASLYDGGSACAEAAMMLVSSHPDKTELIIAGSVNPSYISVIKTYLRHLDIDIKIVPLKEGCVDINILDSYLSGNTAGLIIQSPNFFGNIEDVKTICGKTRQAGGGVVMVCNPLSLGVLSSPAECGVDIAVGEGQPLGVDLSYGGPYFGFIACSNLYTRKMPGRIVGMTTDKNSKRCYVLTLQAREQHIRREKATSNICTNQALIALRGCIYLSWLGKEGFYELSKQNAVMAHYAASQACQIDGVDLAFSQPFFNEFSLKISKGGSVDEVLKKMEAEGVLAGIPAKKMDGQLPDVMIVSVTEKKSLEDINNWVDLLKKAVGSK